MGTRRKARELALQASYLTDLTGLKTNQAFSSLIRNGENDKKTLEFSLGLAEGIEKNKTEIDAIIKKYTANWEMGRMAVLDRNILRVGTYEILFEIETPISVIIDEAVEIAKIFSTPDSGKFVNGILDKVKQERKPKQ